MSTTTYNTRERERERGREGGGEREGEEREKGEERERERGERERLLERCWTINLTRWGPRSSTRPPPFLVLAAATAERASFSKTAE